MPPTKTRTIGQRNLFFLGNKHEIHYYLYLCSDVVRLWR